MDRTQHTDKRHQDNTSQRDVGRSSSKGTSAEGMKHNNDAQHAGKAQVTSNRDDEWSGAAGTSDSNWSEGGDTKSKPEEFGEPKAKRTAGKAHDDRGAHQRDVSGGGETEDVPDTDEDIEDDDLDDEDDDDEDTDEDDTEQRS